MTTNFRPTLESTCFSTTPNATIVKIDQKNRSYITNIISINPAIHLDTSKTCHVIGGADVMPNVTYGIVSLVSLNGVKLPIVVANSAVDPSTKIIDGYYTNWSMYGKAYPAKSIPFNNNNFKYF